MNRAELYRRLAGEYPRSAKAFARKFQNVSAVLYEHRLPFCVGIKPSGNYQNLLKLLVLDHLNRSPRPAVEPHEILLQRLRVLHYAGPIPVNAKGAGRYGLAVEEALGIPPNSSKAPDFMGIELKTKRDRSLQTLFSRTPTRYVKDGGKAAFFEEHHYFDVKRNRKALYTSFTRSPDSLGFSLRSERSQVKVRRAGVTLLSYDAEVLEAALLSKHMQTAFIAISASKKRGRESCTIDRAVYCKWPSIIRFMRLISDGKVFLDLTMSETADGRIKDHGFLWRVKGDALDELYLSTESLVL